MVPIKMSLRYVVDDDDDDDGGHGDGWDDR